MKCPCTRSCPRRSAECRISCEPYLAYAEHKMAEYARNAAHRNPEEYMRICFAMLDVADEMWYLADAADSPGAFLEIQYCRYAKKSVRRFSEAVKEGKCEPHPCD